ncbi:UNVERIFIED_CONTAM: hypothetical protein HHA_450730 [Hammondia hammondi]|eukprot:XP_008883162.1 hypothetical protein HHA_450730 [Hammondia hammondi]
MQVYKEKDLALCPLQIETICVPICGSYRPIFVLRFLQWPRREEERFFKPPKSQAARVEKKWSTPTAEKREGPSFKLRRESAPWRSREAAGRSSQEKNGEKTRGDVAERQKKHAEVYFLGCIVMLHGASVSRARLLRKRK